MFSILITLHKVHSIREHEIILSGGAETISDANTNLVRLKVPMDTFNQQFDINIPKEIIPDYQLLTSFNDQYFYYLITKVNIITSVQKAK